MKKTVWLAVAFVVVVVGFVVWTTFQGERVTCKVCIVFNGQRDCRTASAANRMEAQRTATTNACAQLASGVTDSGHCENTAPESVEWLP
ncbi:MAG TPA: hypothetical protein VNY05_30345 [Candidatus Acidoferrales bacterium]|jgi:hypothetical protein|nr:hypothetical protein [Candidatus Acidoferrales bacterium]